MGLYESTQQAILDREVEDGGLLIVSGNRDDGREGFEYKVRCYECKYGGSAPVVGPTCSLREDRSHENFRKIGGGDILLGSCFRFVSMEKFWDLLSDEISIDPDSGEIDWN